MTTQILSACVEYRAELDRLRAENERLKAALDAAQDIGVYPKEVHHSDGRVERRTEWQDGWNAALEMAHGVIVDALGAARKETQP